MPPGARWNTPVFRFCGDGWLTRLMARYRARKLPNENGSANSAHIAETARPPFDESQLRLLEVYSLGHRKALKVAA
jgi:hypothetical protein